MPLDIKESLNYLGGGLTKIPVIGSLVRNPLTTSLLIAVIIVIVILFVFRNVSFEDEDESLLTLALRAGVYSWFLVIAVQFLQNNYLVNELKKEESNEVIDKVFNAVGGSESNMAEETKDKIPPGESSKYVPVGVNVSFL